MIEVSIKRRSFPMVLDSAGSHGAKEMLVWRSVQKQTVGRKHNEFDVQSLLD